jgi:hypothetical protein
MLTLESLDEPSRDVLSREVFSNLSSSRGSRDPYEVVSETLNEWGIMCSHPQPQRLYGGKERAYLPELASVPWFLCESCGCHVLARGTMGPCPSPSRSASP